MSENPGTEQKKGGKKKPPPRRNNQAGSSHGNHDATGAHDAAPQGGQKRGGGGGGRHYHHHHHNHKIDMKKYEKMISDIQLNFSDILQSNGAKDDCTICWKSCDIFGVGPCRHPICIECALRIRVLGDQKTCPVCRAETEILFLLFASNGLQTASLNFPKHGHPAEDRFAIRFENAAVGERYEQYLAHVCKLCKTNEGDRLEFPTFVSLRQHMASVHHLSYCTICTENLNLFSRERKTYNREALSRHIRCGDVDDKSQKGHPTCLFCSQRFFDNEAQYKHLRKEHFYCQFCEADGTMTNHFFNKHEELVAHYKAKHFLCEHPDCKVAGIAFATVLEFNLHKTTHSENKTVQLDFQYNDRELVGRGRTGRRDNNRPHSSVNVVPQPQQPPPPPRPQTEIIVVPSAQTRLPIRYQRGPAFNARVDDFPTLGGGAGGPSSSAQSQAPEVVVPQAFPRLNKVGKANHPAAAAADKNKNKLATPVDHFPSLGGNRPATAPNQSNNWGKHTGGFDVIDDYERMGSVSRPPAAVLQPPPASRPAAVLRKPQQPQKPAAPIPSEDFPCLPQAKGGLALKSDWANKAKGKSVITGVKMPKKKLAMPDVLPERSMTTSAADYKAPEESWEDVPMKRKMTKKERKAMEERMQLSEAMQREEEEKELRQRMMVAPAADVEMQRVLMEDIARNSTGNSASTSAESSSSNVSVGKKEFSNAAKGKNAGSQTNGEQEKKKNGKKQKAPEQTAANFPSLASSQKKAAAPVEPEPEEPASGLSSWLFSSVSNVFSGLSLSNVLGTDSSQPLSSMSTQVIPQKPVNNTTVAAPPPGLERVPSVPSPSATDGISFDAPPGFEDMMMPPGLGNSAKDNQLFSMAPFPSQQDTQRPVPSAPSATTADGWSSSKNGKKGRAK